MAVGTLSDFFINRQARPRTKGSVATVGARLRWKFARLTFVAGALPAAGDVSPLLRFKEHDRLWQMWIDSQDVNYTSNNIGLYIPAAADYADGGTEPTVIDADLLAGALDFGAAAISWTEFLAHQAAAQDGANLGQPLWQLAGETEGTRPEYDVCFEMTAGAGDPGSIAFGFAYTAGD